MSFPNIDFAKQKANVTSAIRAWGNDATFTLPDTDTTFTIKATKLINNNKGSTQPMTAGINQYDLKCMVLYDDWHNAAGAGRRPQKGDIITTTGKTYALMGVFSVGAGVTLFGYDLRVRG